MAGAGSMKSSPRVLGTALRPFEAYQELLVRGSGVRTIDTAAELVFCVCLCSRDQREVVRMLSSRFRWRMYLAALAVWFRMVRAGINGLDQAVFLRERAAFVDYMKAAVACPSSGEQ